jgi:pyrroline-5-carboxylate reductase
MTLAFIGGGNMASALIGGLRTAGERGRIIVVDIDPERRSVLSQTHGVDAFEAIPANISKAEVIILAVKPGDIRTVCTSLAPLLKDQTHCLLLSIAAGIPSERIAQWAKHPAVVRAMPNTPALIGRGMTGLYARSEVTAAQRQAISRIIAVTGQSVWLESEQLIDAVTAISGSGPAYVFLFLEALEKAATSMGLSAEQGRRLAVETFSGAAELAARSPEALSTLRERVTSRGGTTAAALAVMGSGHLPDILIAAAQAARARSEEMARDYGQE